MKKTWRWLLLAGLAGCGKQIDLSSDVALTHQHDAAFRQQVQQLGAGRVRLTTAPASPGAATPQLLMLEVSDLREKSPQPDTLRQRIHKLAHLLALDVAHPERYQAVAVQVRVQHDLPSDKADVWTYFNYSLPTLR